MPGGYAGLDGEELTLQSSKDLVSMDIRASWTWVFSMYALVWDGSSPFNNAMQFGDSLGTGQWGFFTVTSNAPIVFLLESGKLSDSHSCTPQLVYSNVFYMLADLAYSGLL